MLRSRTFFGRCCFQKRIPKPRKLSSRLSETLIFTRSLFLPSATLCFNKSSNSSLQIHQTSIKNACNNWIANLITRFTDFGMILALRMEAKSIQNHQQIDFGRFWGTRRRHRGPKTAARYHFWENFADLGWILEVFWEELGRCLEMCGWCGLSVRGLCCSILVFPAKSVYFRIGGVR